MEMTAKVPNPGDIAIDVEISMDATEWITLLNEMVEKEIDSEFVLMLEDRINRKVKDLERSVHDKLVVKDCSMTGPEEAIKTD